jgi:MFS family permease
MLMNTPGIFYPGIADDLGVQTAEISAWMAICLLSAAVFQPWLGNVVSRMHMRTLMLIGSLTMVVVFLVFSVASAPWMFWAAAVVTGFPFAACLSVGPATLVNRWFNQHVGLILGMTAASSALGGVTFMLIGQAIIESLGWRTAYLVYAAIIILVCVPAVLLCIRDYPADCGLEPYGEPDTGMGGEATPTDSADATDVERRARACMATPAFVLLLVAGFLMNMVCQVNGYLPKYVYWVDEQATLGAMPVAFVTGVVLSSLTQAGSGVGKLILGAFSDFSVRNALVLLCAGGAAGIACVWGLPSTAFMAVGGFVYGFFLAAVLVLIPMLVRDIFGSGDLYPVLYARIAITPAIGGAAANIVWPYIADNLGGFDVVFGLALVMIAVILVTALTALRLGNTARSS